MLLTSLVSLLTSFQMALAASIDPQELPSWSGRYKVDLTQSVPPGDGIERVSCSSNGTYQLDYKQVVNPNGTSHIQLTVTYLWPDEGSYVVFNLPPTDGKTYRYKKDFGAGHATMWHSAQVDTEGAISFRERIGFFGNPVVYTFVPRDTVTVSVQSRGLSDDQDFLCVLTRIQDN